MEHDSQNLQTSVVTIKTGRSEPKHDSATAWLLFFHLKFIQKANFGGRWSSETVDSEVCGLNRVVGTLSLERLTAVKSFRSHFLVLWAAQTNPFTSKLISEADISKPIDKTHMAKYHKGYMEKYVFVIWAN